MQKRIHAFYSGRVQGVGFRFTVESLARELDVTGWVQNLRDGRVELVAEAGEAVLHDLLSRIEQHFRGYIRNQDFRWQPASGEFEGFGIKLFSL